MNSLQQFKKDCLTAAALVGNYMDYEKFPKDENIIANGYLKAVEDKNEVKQNGYLAMLMLRHWKDIGKLYNECKTTGNLNERADFSTIVWERIMYAMKYHRWNDEDSNTNAQACINRVISTEKLNQLYNSNLDKNRANAGTMSMDTPINSDSDDRETTLADTMADPHEGGVISKADCVVQLYVDNDKLVEAIVIDTIANGDTTKFTSENTTYTYSEKNSETGEIEEVKVKSKTNYREFWRYKAAQLLMNLPEDYEKLFAAKFHVAYEKICEAVNAVRTAKNPKIYKYLDNTIADMQAQKESIIAFLS